MFQASRHFPLHLHTYIQGTTKVYISCTKNWVSGEVIMNYLSIQGSTAHSDWQQLSQASSGYGLSDHLPPENLYVEMPGTQEATLPKIRTLVHLSSVPSSPTGRGSPGFIIGIRCFTLLST